MNIQASLPQIVRVLATMVLLVSAIGCRMEDATATATTPLRIGDVARAIEAPSPYAAGEYMGVIGPAGGTLDFGIGQVEFPPNALDRYFTISAAVDGHSVAVNFGPEGLHFIGPTKPVLRFRVGRSMSRGAEVFYVGDNDVIKEVLPARSGQRTIVEAELRHFSKYIFGVE